MKKWTKDVIKKKERQKCKYDRATKCRLTERRNTNGEKHDVESQKVE
jgi:hypothetical protein